MENELQPILSHAEPVLAVKDVVATISYWKDILGFPNQWTWGEPPTLGSVSWHGAFVQFFQNQQLASISKESAVWMRVQHIEALYDFHQKKGAEIVTPLEYHSWGMSQYCIQDINGYFISFAGVPISDRAKSAAGLPATVKIIARMPTAKEKQHLAISVGWKSTENQIIEYNNTPSIVYAVVAEDITSNKIIGCAFLLGGYPGFYYIKDVIVHPDWQGKRVGTALMRELTRWIDTHAPANASTWLHTGEHLAPFYRQFDFAPAFGMVRMMPRDENEGK